MIKPKTFAEAEKMIAEARRQEQDVRNLLIHLRQQASALYTAEMGIGMGTRVILHNYSRNYNDPKHDQTAVVTGMFTGYYGTPSIKVSIITASGAVGKRMFDLPSNWSKAP